MISPATAHPNVHPAEYPIGTPGQPWDDADIAAWRARQVRRRSYADDVLKPAQALAPGWVVQPYGEVAYADERFPLVALHSSDWRPGLPAVLVTGGVHGYETSGVLGALRFAQQHAQTWTGRVNLLIAPCVSPWAYERIHRWNFDAVDPNRQFRDGSTVQECAALMRLVAALRAEFAAHIDLHETTDTDETEYRPALAARDGKAFVPGHIPDGFYLVDDADNPQPAFQQAIIEAVQGVTHIAPADAQGQIIGSPVVAPGVISYALGPLALCAGITGARWTTTTEVYPDSPRTTPERCVLAQVAAVCAAVDFVAASS